MRRRRIYSKICLILAILCMGGFFYMLVTDSFPGTVKKSAQQSVAIMCEKDMG